MAKVNKPPEVNNMYVTITFSNAQKVEKDRKLLLRQKDKMKKPVTFESSMSIAERISMHTGDSNAYMHCIHYYKGQTKLF